MSLEKVGASRPQASLEQMMGMKQRPYYHPNILNYTTHPESAENQPNHKHHAFDEYWRNTLPRVEKFTKDPSIKSKASLADKARRDAEDAAYVRQLSKNDGEPSDELVLEGKINKKGPKK